ncbi:MAG: hypothetical protein A2Z99_10715 [Treponema sp. GWB1_62_6]|nr:MAG: hypothetical protein A2Z99_10715 [Treponema sp. GWB1_62_6]OHE62792.1 MAG: hypothetical protein A2Y36_06255 [Treponema sp. GWA1_62_8]OHE63454.1 MAG: hypothetical protein A2001_03305 [Treponema sp. GWC1_61_84]HCM26494.1 hypothetical protein [Treponema sp.]
MKEILVGMAEYNRSANEKLIGTLRGADAAVLIEDQGAFYKSVIGTLEHIASGEIGFLRRFSGFFPYACLAPHRFITGNIDEIKAAFHDDPPALYAVLAEADSLMVEFVHAVLESELTQRVSYTTAKGDRIERIYWNLIVHVLNHSTHHRGEISVLLDRKGIANDYSGFNLYTK